MAGSFWTLHTCMVKREADTEEFEQMMRSRNADKEKEIKSAVDERVQTELFKKEKEFEKREAEIIAREESIKTSSVTEKNVVTGLNIGRFQGQINTYMKGMARVNKDEFVKAYDFGTPQDTGGEVMIIYNHDQTLPSDRKKADVVSKERGEGVALLDTQSATENCDYMYVVTVPNDNARSCVAINQNYENYHMQKWLRTPGHKQPLDHNTKLRAVSRGQLNNGRVAFNPPDMNLVRKHWGMLQTYFSSIDDVINELKPILERVAVDNTIVVLTCNHGQSELLMNFVCNARAKNMDLKNVLVFPTDKETKELAEGLGLATFYDERNFEHLPSKEARAYGDATFKAMMFAKVVCVQIVNMLGYDLLFQDVDVIWYENPLEYFHDKANPLYDFDMYFQDDGAHSARYAPYSANSGFYYVRSNDLTRYFFVSLLYAGDIILRSSSHQQALIQVMTEHASMFGLRVKVLGRDMAEFPGGWHYHRRKDFMKDVVQGNANAKIFHMSWTSNKMNKLKFFQQMGEWYLNEKCIGETKGTIAGNTTSPLALIQPCCLADAAITCHYKDKPSKIPCNDSPPIDKGGRSFW